jgi:predicted nucleic acid-binding protein
LFLLDTNVISELRKGTRANAGVRKFFVERKNYDATLFLSAITVGELRCGVERIRQRGDLPQGDRLESWLQSVLQEFREQVLDFDLEAAQLWGVLQAVDPQHSLDNQIAATALLYGLTVVTRNESDFSGTGVEVLNPWT